PTARRADGSTQPSATATRAGRRAPRTIRRQNGRRASCRQAGDTSWEQAACQCALRLGRSGDRRDEHIDFMMQIVRARGERDRFVIRDERIRGLQEEGRFSLVVAHLTCMRGIVAADTVDATDRVARLLICDCDGGPRRRSEYELHESEYEELRIGHAQWPAAGEKQTEFRGEGMFVPLSGDGGETVLM